MVVFGDRLKVLLECELQLTGCSKSVLAEKIGTSDSWVSATVGHPGSRMRTSILERLNAYFETEGHLISLLGEKGPGDDVVRWLGQRYTMAEAKVREMFRLPDEADNSRPPVSDAMSAAGRRKPQPPPKEAAESQPDQGLETPAQMSLNLDGLDMPAWSVTLAQALVHHKTRCEQLGVTDPLARSQVLNAILADVVERKLQL